MIRRLGFALAVLALVSGAGLLLRAEPPQAVGTWASIGTAPENRIGAAAVALPDGRTLIVGGLANGTPTDAVVVFDPADSSFATAGQLLEPRAGHTATLLEDGRVLIAGGKVNDILTGDLEIFDPSTGASALVATLAELRSGHAAARFGDGRVLIAGGTGTDGVLQTAEIFDPETGSVSFTLAPLQSPRAGASATTLIDGRVLIAGGSNGTQDLASAEIYNPSTESFQPTDTNLDAPRSGHMAVLLPHNNSVLIAGGTSDGVPLATADLFVPAQFPDPYSYGMGQFALTGEMAAPRSGAAGGPHIEGYAFVVGGGQPDAEVYRFATIKTDKDDYAPGQTAIITGSGWEANEEVRLLFQEDPAVHDDYVLTVTADGDGNIYHDEWAPEEHDLGVRFYMMAMGQQSGRRAQTTFTDDTNVQTGTVTIRNGSCTSNQSVFNQGDTVCARVVVTATGGGGAAGPFFIQWLDPSSNLVTPPSTTETTPSTVPTIFDRTFATTTSTATGGWTVRLCRNSQCNGANLVASATFTLNAVTTFNVTFDATPIADVAAGTTVLSVTIGANPATTVTKAELPKTFTGIASGTNVTYSYSSPLAVSATKQYRWLSTSGTGSASGQTTQSGGPFSVTANSTVSATYLAQFKVTFDASANVKSDGTGTIVTVAGSPKAAGDLPFTTSFIDSGTSVTYSYSSPVASATPTTKRYRWDSTTGLGQTLQTNTFSVTAAGIVTGTYVAQFQVTFDASANVKSDSSGTIVTVNGSPKTTADLPFTAGFVDTGTSVSYAYSSPVASTGLPTAKQYRWNSTSGVSQTLQSNTFSINAGGTVIGTYIAQFKVTFDASANVKGDSTATIVTVNGSPKNGSALPFTTAFIDDGTSITYSYSSPVASTALPATKQYRWGSTSGLTQTLQTNTFSVTAAGTVTGAYIAQFKVTFDASANVKGDSSATIVTIDGSPKAAGALPFTTPFIDDGTSVTYSYSSPVASTASPTTKQYRWDSTSGLAQTLQTNTFSVTAAGTVTGTYVAQFQVTFDASANVKGDSSSAIVTVDAAPKSAADLPFSKFVDSGASVAYDYSSPVASTASPPGKQYRWDSTSGLAQTLQTNTFSVTAAGTVTGSYVAQFKVTFDASANVKGDSSATIVTVEGSPKAAADLPFSTGFVDEGSSLSYSYSSPVASTALPTTKQYRWDSTSGLSQTLQTNTFSVTATGTVTGTYVAQFKVTFDASANVKGDSSATIVTVDGSPKAAGDLPFTTNFIDDGTSVGYSYSSPVASTSLPTTKQYRWGLTSGLSQTLQSHTFAVTDAGTVTGTYIAQFKVTFDASANVKGDSSATIVTIDGSPKTTGDLPFTTNFVDDGTSVTYSYSSPVASTAFPTTKRYRWDATSGLAQTLQINTFSVTAAGTVTGTYVAQFKVTFDASANVKGDSSATIVTIDGSPKTAGDLPFTTLFVDEGTSVTYSYSSPVASTALPTTKQYRWDSTSGLAQTLQTNTFSVTAAGTVTGTYVAQFKVTFDASANVKGDSSATIVTVGGSPKTAGDLPFSTGFVDEGTSVSYSYSSPVASMALPTTKQYRWDSTSGLSQTLQTNTFNVTAGGTVTGTYVAQFKVTFDASANVKGDSSATIVTVDGSPKSAGALPFTTAFIDENTSISYSYSSPVASTALPTTKQYRWDSTSGLAQRLQTNSFNVAAAGTVTGTYIAQFKLTFDASANVKGDSSATIVTIDGSPKAASDLPFTTNFVDDSTSVNYSYSSPVASSALPTTKQYRWGSTSGLSQTLQTNTFSVTAAGTVTGTYIAQFLVTFDASANVKSDSSATIVSVDAVAKTAAALPFAKFIDAGTSVAYNYFSPIASAANPANTRYRWNSTTGLSQTLQANTFMVTAPGTVTGNYVTQFTITWTQTGLAGTGGNTVVTVNAVAKTAAALPFSNWFDVGASVPYAYATPISTDPVSSIQFELTNAGSLPVTPITVSAPMVINGDYSTNTYTIQYLQPIDQSSGTNYHVNSGKNGRVIPVKVLIFKNGVAISDSSTVIMKVAGSNCSSGPGADPIEEYADAGQSNGNTYLFRWSSPHWIYNLDTKALGLVTNNCYRLDVYLNMTTGSTSIKASSLTWAIFKPVR